MAYIDRDGVQFRTLRLRDRPTEIKGSHLLEIPFGEASAETFGKIVRQTLERRLCALIHRTPVETPGVTEICWMLGGPPEKVSQVGTPEQLLWSDRAFS
jgi:hypothetical protein